MRFLLSIFGFWLSVPAVAGLLPYNPQSCNALIALNYDIYTQGAVSFTRGTDEMTIDAGGMTRFMGDFLSQIDNGFKNAKDITTLSQKNPLCYGMYHDEKGANAIAIGKDNIYFGFNMLVDMQTEWNIEAESGIKAILAHEYAHIIQHRLELPFNLPLPLLNTKRKELQADCIAGVLITYHHPSGRAVIESDRLMHTIGSHHAVSSHGLKAERRTALLHGMKGALRLMMNGKNKTNTHLWDVVNSCTDLYPFYR